jgi:hypothetical protein
MRGWEDGWVPEITDRLVAKYGMSALEEKWKELGREGLRQLVAGELELFEATRSEIAAVLNLLESRLSSDAMAPKLQRKRYAVFKTDLEV